MGVKPLFITVVNWFLGVVFRAGAHMLARHIQIDFAITPTDASCPFGRDQNLAAGPPVARVDQQVAHLPTVAFNEDILDMTDAAVSGLDIVPNYFI